MRQANDNGYFVFVNVRPGRYTLSVEHAGFSTSPGSPRSPWAWAKRWRQNVSLRVGEITESVEVTAQSELLQASTASSATWSRSG